LALAEGQKKWPLTTDAPDSLPEVTDSLAPAGLGFRDDGWGG
jgi:hypothetical protein